MPIQKGRHRDIAEYFIADGAVSAAVVEANLALPARFDGKTTHTDRAPPLIRSLFAGDRPGEVSRKYGSRPASPSSRSASPSPASATSWPPGRARSRG